MQLRAVEMDASACHKLEIYSRIHSGSLILLLCGQMIAPVLERASVGNEIFLLST